MNDRYQCPRRAPGRQGLKRCTVMGTDAHQFKAGRCSIRFWRPLYNAHQNAGPVKRWFVHPLRPVPPVYSVTTTMTSR